MFQQLEYTNIQRLYHMSFIKRHIQLNFVIFTKFSELVYVMRFVIIHQ